MKVFKIVNFYLICHILLGFMYSASVPLCFSNAEALIEDENHSPTLSLLGIVVATNTSSVAVLKDEETGKTVIVKVGDSILNMELTHVFQDGIILKKGEKIHWFLLEKSLPFKAEKETQRSSQVDEKFVQEKNLSKSVLVNHNMPQREFVRSEVQKRVEQERALIIKETSVVPNYVNGKFDGFKVIGLPMNSIASEVGIQKDDVIKEINGVKLNNLSALVKLYSKISVEERYEVLIERDKKLIRQVYILK